MDTSTGRIYEPEAFEKAKELMTEDQLKNFKQVDHATPEQVANGKVGRNEICPCGSNKKFKKCCLKTTPHTGPIYANIKPAGVCKECFLRPRENGARCRKCSDAHKNQTK